MAMRIYRAPSGLCFQFPEGEQPKGYVLVKPAPKGYVLVKPAPKRATPKNKAAKPADK